MFQQSMMWPAGGGRKVNTFDSGQTPEDEHQLIVMVRDILVWGLKMTATLRHYRYVAICSRPGELSKSGSESQERCIASR